MNVITVFKDPVCWSLDVVTRMAQKMNWTANMISMVVCILLINTNMGLKKCIL